MPQTHVSIISGSARVVVHDFARGSKIIPVPHSRRRENVDTVLARAAWLENRGRREEANRYLEPYLS